MIVMRKRKLVEKLVMDSQWHGWYPWRGWYKPFWMEVARRVREEGVRRASKDEIVRVCKEVDARIKENEGRNFYDL